MAEFTPLDPRSSDFQDVDERRNLSKPNKSSTLLGRDLTGFIHKELAAGPWFQLSLMQQLAHIGSEVGRARNAQKTDEKRFASATLRALDLFDLTLEDPRWKGRRWEIARARELFCAASLGKEEYATSLGDLDKYFLPFAVAAQTQTQR